MTKCLLFVEDEGLSAAGIPRIVVHVGDLFAHDVSSYDEALRRRLDLFQQMPMGRKKCRKLEM